MTLKRIYREFRQDNLPDTAAALTYYAVLSIFSALMALVVVVGLVSNPHTIARELTILVKALGPPSAAEALKGPINSLSESHRTAGILLIINFGSTLWTASGYVGTFMRASNVIYEVEEGRSSVKLRPLQVLVTVIMVVVVALILVGLVLTGSIAQKVGAVAGLNATTVTVWEIAKWPVMIILVMAMTSGLYYAGPNAKLRGFKSIIPGALLSVLVWLVSSIGFAIYVVTFNSYNSVYAALGVIVGLLVALWVINVAVLLGAEVNAERERARQIEDHAPGAELELQLEPRSTPKP